MSIFEASFIFLSTVCLILYLFTANSTQQSAAGGDGSFRRFQRMYLIVYFMAQGNDVCCYTVNVYAKKLNLSDNVSRTFIRKKIANENICVVISI